MADFSWNLDSNDAPDRAECASVAATEASVSRRVLRAQEAAATPSLARGLRAPRSRKAPRSLKAPRSRKAPRTLKAPRSLKVAPPARSTAPRREKVLRKLVTISAMFGAGALLVATSLPAVALHVNSASAITPELSASTSSEVQTLAVDGGAVDTALLRDPYTVVNTIQQARMKLGDQGFLYTNDTNGTIQWPFPAPVPISSGFGARVSPCSGCSSFHEGVDFIPGAGTPIGAVDAGTVTFAAFDSSFGYHVIIDHNINGQKVQSLYAHMLAGSIKVVVGQQVTVAQELGEVGSTGHSTGAHLHLEIHLDGTPVDPFAWLKANAN